MSARRELTTSLIASALVLALLVWLAAAAPPALSWPAAALFTALIVFALSFSIVIGEGLASLLPLLAIVAMLSLGPTVAAWVAYVAAWIHGGVRWRYGTRLALNRPTGQRDLLARTAVNATNHSLSVLAAGLVYRLWQLAFGVNSVAAAAGGLLALALTFFAVNHAIVTLYYALARPQSLDSHWRHLPAAVAYELVPVLLVPFAVTLYQRLGLIHFAAFALVLVLVSLITHSLDRTRERLMRRVRELQSLHAVGQAVTASLELSDILEAIYRQVRHLMPADTFYVALYEHNTAQISFPIFVREGQKISWPSRRAGNGLTEHILRTRRPLLVRRDLPLVLAELGLNQIGVLASSWLGVPIIAGDQILGVLSVQSIPHAEVYDTEHQEMLMTIASQAGMAIQHARLFAATDSSLDQRVQELDSVFRTTQDGILLLSPDWRILAANRAFSRLVGLIGIEPAGQSALRWPAPGPPLVERLGFDEKRLVARCRRLALKGEGSQARDQLKLPEGPSTHVERTLTAVYDRDGRVSGWLVVLRDVTEEVSLARLREEMMHMLVHDLRAPLSLLLGNVEMGRELLGQEEYDSAAQLLEAAEKNGAHMLRLINDLLDIYKLESGSVPLQRQPVPAGALLQDVSGQFAPLIRESRLQLTVSPANGLPALWADYDHVSRVVYNLLDNAIKFTPDEGRIDLWARRDGEGEGPAVLIGVSDTGPGIPAGSLNELFQKFRRVETGGRRQGTGLGLPYCRLVVEAHGGQIWVQSPGELGQGSTFVMRLPCAPADPQTPANMVSVPDAAPLVGAGR